MAGPHRHHPKTVTTTWKVRGQVVKTVSTTWNVLGAGAFDITVTGYIFRGHSGHVLAPNSGTLVTRQHAGHVVGSNTGTVERDHQGTVTT